MDIIVSIVFMVLLLCACISLAIWYTCLSMDQGEKPPAEPEVEHIELDQYVTGLPSCDRGAAKVKCQVQLDHLVFFSFFGNELGRIARNSVNEIIVEDKTTVHKRITATRLLTFGIFAIAVPKTTTEAEYCLMIDWTDQDGARQNALFLFTGIGSMSRAHKVANFLRRQRAHGIPESILRQQTV